MSGIALLLAVMALAPARPADFAARAAVQESLAGVHPRLRSRWLTDRSLSTDDFIPVRMPDSGSGLRLVGKYGRGPSVEITGAGDLVYVALGSEVAIVSFASPDSPVVLSELQAPQLVSNIALKDSFLLVGVGCGVDIWNVARPAECGYSGSITVPVSDLCVRDSLLCIVGGDSLRTYSVEDPTNPRRLGTCRVPGSAVAVSGNKAVVYYYDYMSVVDISNPTQPVSVGSYGAFVLGLAMRGNTVCANVVWNTLGDHFRFEVLDISNPASVRRIGAIDSVGGYDIHWDGPLAFVSGYYYNWEFSIVAMTDSTHPSVVSRCTTPGDGWGVWADLTSDRAYLADRYGLTVVDISDLGRPAVDTNFLRAGLAQDVCVDGGIAYIASSTGGMRIVDVSDPTRPRELAGVDTTNPQRSVVRAVAARDSFAYMGWPNWDNVLTLDVSNPTRPVKVGGCDLFNWPEAMVLRDSFLYCAEFARFQVVNVARPRQPVLVGWCVAGDLTRAGLVVRDTVAYFVGPFDGMQVFSVANPAAPRLLATVGDIRAMGCDVVDTLLYVGDYDDSLHIWNVANPAVPRQIASVPATRCGYGVAVIDRYAYVGCDARVRVFDVSDPMNPREVASGATPYEISRVVTDGQHVYVCCWDAGVCIFDTATTGIGENGAGRHAADRAAVGATVTRGTVMLEITDVGGKEVMLSAYDIAGQLVDRRVLQGQGAVVRYSFAHLPAGVYILRLRAAERACTFRIVKL